MIHENKPTIRMVPSYYWGEGVVRKAMNKIDEGDEPWIDGCKVNKTTVLVLGCYEVVLEPDGTYQLFDT